MFINIIAIYIIAPRAGVVAPNMFSSSDSFFISSNVFPWASNCTSFLNSLNQKENFTAPALYLFLFNPGSPRPHRESFP